MANNTKSFRLPQSWDEFKNRANANRIKYFMEEKNMPIKEMGNPEFINHLIKFFKSDNQSYIRFVSME